MKKPAIFLFFLLALLTGAAALCPSTAAGIELPITVTGEGAEERAGQLQTVYLRLIRLFRLTPRRPVAELEIALSPAVPADSPEYRVLDSERHLIVCNLSGDFFSLPAAARRRLYGAMLLTLLPNPKRRSPDFLPGWFSLGIDQALASRDSTERWVRTNRLLPVLRGLAGHGKHPPFEALESLAADPSEPDPAAAEWIGEMARCRFALMQKTFFTAGGIGAFLRGDGKIRDRFTEQECAAALRSLAWNRMHPRPGELAAAAFAPLAVVKYPEIDAAGKPTGKTSECRLEMLGAALAEHPDRKAIMIRTADDYLRTSYGDAAGIRRAAEQVALLLRGAAERDRREAGPDREIADALRKLGESIDDQRALDALLDRFAEENTSLADGFRFRFRTVRRASRLAAPEVERMLSEFAHQDGR